MNVVQFLDALGYTESPAFISTARHESDMGAVTDYGHVFRKATAQPCCLQGVYTLRSTSNAPAPVTPIVYVCSATTEAEADEIHRLVWNQDIVPFLLVHTPAGVKLYSGFSYEKTARGPARGVLRALTAFNEMGKIVESFSAEAVDCGQVWSRYGNRVTPDQRVDKKLLRNLQALDRWLRTQGGLRKDVSHALIGKFVYFHYLKDRGFISPRKLERWNLEECAVFGRDVQIDAVVEMTRSLEDSLNGQIFPFDFDSPEAPRQQHLTWVAGIFSGDEVSDGGRQLSLDFNAYNFSYIPIETLSIIYEQFLHTPEENAGVTSGKEAGAYYTPLPLVNFILSEMEDNVPLEKGTAIFDPSCGSGAFLVQCYRRLIEKEMYRENRDLKPTELRDLLVRHVFGVDRDPDACSLTELSLLLTLLDYVDPPDLENTSFKLPSLRGENIFESDFFDDDTPWERKLAKQGRIWVVGNPPWKKLEPSDLSPAD